MSWLDDITSFLPSSGSSDQPAPDNYVELPQNQPTPTPSLYDPQTMLSPHYSLANLTLTNQQLSSPNLPSSVDQYNNLVSLANFFEILESEVGPFQIISGFRTGELQNALASSGEPVASGTSFHELGRGADIYPTTMSLDAYFGKMLANPTIKDNLAEVAYKPGQKSIHLGINVPGDVRSVKVLALNDQNVYGKLSLDEIESFIKPYMQNAQAAADYAAAQLVSYNRTPLYLVLAASLGTLAYMYFGNRRRSL